MSDKKLENLEVSKGVVEEIDEKPEDKKKKLEKAKAKRQLSQFDQNILEAIKK